MGPRRGVAVVLLIVIAVASGCSDNLDDRSGDGASGPPPTNADGAYAYEDAAVAGTVLGPDGEPLSDVDVSVVAGATAASQTGSLLTMMFTGGLGCLTGGCEGFEHREVAAIRTEADGSYSATLPDAYLPGFETDTDWLVTASVPAEDGQVLGPTSSFEFEANTPVQNAPALSLWDASPTIEPGDLVRVRIAEPPPVPDGKDPSTSVRFVDAAGSEVWTMETDVVDARLLEDFELRALGVHTVSVRVAHEHGRTIYHQHLVSGVVAFRGGLVPVSRGLGCTTGSAEVSGCPVTDGVLQPLTDTSPVNATVELQPDTAVGLIVVRGGTGCDVEISSDDGGWVPLETTSLSGTVGLTVAPSAPLVGDSIRVGGPDCTGISELSVWSPAEPDTPGGAVDDETGLFSVGAPDRDVLVPAVVAAALAGMVGALCVMRWRRQRPRTLRTR